MQGALRLGRIGTLTVYFNYTWIFAALLILWWVALLWLPENYPRWSGGGLWITAIVVVLLFAACMIAHELVHSAFAGTGPRTANLFPFGAAVPFRLQDVPSGRALASALAGPVFNLVLSGALLLLGSAFPGPDHPLGLVRAVAIPLSWLNLGVGVINLIPGIPFDGGWALSAGVALFSNDREGGLGPALALGRLAAVVLVLIGAWVGLAGDTWLLALGLVVVGWAAREAGNIGQQRSTLRALLAEMKAADFMQPARPDDVLRENTTVADMVLAHTSLPPATPLPVVDDEGTLVGITNTAAADRLLQGTWSNTPVRAIARPVSEVRAVHPATPLLEVLVLAQAQAANVSADYEPGPQAGGSDAPPGTLEPGVPEDTQYVPVIAGDTLVGSIDPARLQTFESAGRQFGVEEAINARDGEDRRGPLALLGSLFPIVALLAAMALLGAIAVRTDPMELQEVVDGSGSSITFSTFSPADGDVVGLGEFEISVQVEGASPVTSATISIDGNPLETQLAGASPLTQTATGLVPGLTLGYHTARIAATTEDGERRTRQWEFRVDPRAVGGPEEQPTPVPGEGNAAEPLKLGEYTPALGARVPAGEGFSETLIGLVVNDTQPPQSAQILLDGQELAATVEPVEGAEGRYRVRASEPVVQPGPHRVRVEVIGSAGSANASEWTFSALQPGADNAYFKETGYFVTQPFLGYWQENGGLAMFGYPISDLVRETDEASGEVYSAQYFERARFEQHPSLGNAVLLGRLGALLHEPEPPAEPVEGTQFFSETGHNLSGKFRDYWNNNGGLAQFGYPISEERMEVNPIDGKEYLVQYFERARFELHPEFAGTPFEVQLGQLGTELYRQKYGG